MDLYKQENREPLVQVEYLEDGKINCNFAAANGNHQLSCVGYKLDNRDGRPDTPIICVDNQSASFRQILMTCFPTSKPAPHFIECSDMNIFKIPASGRRKIFRMKQLQDFGLGNNKILTDADPASQNRVFADMVDLFYNKLRVKEISFSTDWSPINAVTGYNKILSSYLLLNGGYLGGHNLFTTGKSYVNATLYKLTENRSHNGVTVNIKNPCSETNKDNIKEIKRRYRDALYATWEQYRNYRQYRILDMRELKSIFMINFYKVDAEGYSIGLPFEARSFISLQAALGLSEIRNVMIGEQEKNQLLLRNSAFTQEDFEIFADNASFETTPSITKLVWSDTDEFDILYDSFYFGNSPARQEVREYTSALMNFRGIVAALELRLSNDYGVDDSFLFEEMTAEQARNTLGKNVLTAANKYENINKEKRSRNVFYRFPPYVLDAVYAWHRHREEFNLSAEGLTESIKKFIPELPHEHPMARMTEELNAFDSYEDYQNANQLEEEEWEDY